MGDNLKQELQWEEKPSACSVCGGGLTYVSRGEYRCSKCGHSEYDDFGKICRFIDVNGPSPAIVIAEGTGVSINKINNYLRQGRVEIPEGSKVYIKCEKCGRDIRFGRFCPECALKLSKQLQGIVEAGEVPRRRINKEEGKMRFLGRDKKRI